MTNNPQNPIDPNNPVDPQYPAQGQQYPAQGYDTTSGYGATASHRDVTPTTTTVDRHNPMPGWILAAGGGLLALATLLPWLTGESRGGEDGSANGWDMEDIPGVWDFPWQGWIFLVLGLALLAHGVAYALRALGDNTRILAMIATVASALALILSILAILDVNGFVGEIQDAVGDAGDFGLGFGMWLLPIASLIALAGSVMALMNKDRVDTTTTTVRH